MRALTAVVAAALVLLPAAPAWAANQAPVVVDDTVTYRNNGGIDYPVNALANDSDPDGDTLTYHGRHPGRKGRRLSPGRATLLQAISRQHGHGLVRVHRHGRPGQHRHRHGHGHPVGRSQDTQPTCHQHRGARFGDAGLARDRACCRVPDLSQPGAGRLHSQPHLDRLRAPRHGLARLPRRSGQRRRLRGPPVERRLPLSAGVDADRPRGRRDRRPSNPVPDVERPRQEWSMARFPGRGPGCHHRVSQVRGHRAGNGPRIRLPGATRRPRVDCLRQ